MKAKFPSELKHLEVMILFKKEDPLMKKNYRQILPHLLKVFERAIYKQLNVYMENKQNL